MIRVTLRQARAIEAGRATQVRVIPAERKLVKRKDAAKRGRSAMRWQEPWHPTIDAEESVTGTDGKTAVTCRVVIADRWQEPLSAMTVQDARRQGHGPGAGSIFEARAEWVRQHDKAWITHHKLWLADVLGPNVVHDILCRRFERRWADVATWVVTFEAVMQPPVLLASQRDILSGRSWTPDEHRVDGVSDFTTNPSRAADDLECVDARTLRRFSHVAGVTAEEARASLVRDLEEARAMRAGVETDGLSNRALRHIVAAAERREISGEQARAHQRRLKDEAIARGAAA